MFLPASRNLLIPHGLAAFVLVLLFISCKPTIQEPQNPAYFPEYNNDGLSLPDNFGALVVMDGNYGRSRHMAISKSGDIYVRNRRLQTGQENNGIMAISDTSSDGKADIVTGFSEKSGTGIALHKGYLYYSDRTAVYRSPIEEGELFPGDQVDTIAHMVEGSGHMEKPFTFDGKGNMYVNVGSMSNACEQPLRTGNSPGEDPCTELQTRGGIWKFSEDQLHQQQDISNRYATGIRNAIALTWNFEQDKLYALQHGRDDLHRYWPDLFTEEENVELPAEEFLEVEEGDDFGWPYCYYDPFKKQKFLNPEYGGDGDKVERCAQAKQPLYGFPGHWAPNDVLFYTGDQFPTRYKEGAFIAFHGSWNRLNHEQDGYRVVFLPMIDGQPTGEYEDFATDFIGESPILESKDARHRPCGLAQGPDGSLYISDGQRGKIWRILYYPEGLPEVEEKSIENLDITKQGNVPTPPDLLAGKKVYDTYCTACHASDGSGVAGINPPLKNTDWVTGDKERLLKVIFKGLSEELIIDGESFQSAMASHSFLSDQQISDVLTYVRKSFGNDAEAISIEEVSIQREVYN